MNDKPDLIQTIATISSMCEMDLSQETHNEMFEFVAKGIRDLEKQIEREGKLILKMKDDISFYKRKVNNLTQKLKSRKR